MHLFSCDPQYETEVTCSYVSKVSFKTPITERTMINNVKRGIDMEDNKEQAGAGVQWQEVL